MWYLIIIAVRIKDKINIKSIKLKIIKKSTNNKISILLG